MTAGLLPYCQATGLVGPVERAAAVARLTKAAETSLAAVVAVMVYCNWIEVVMLVAALLL